MNDKMKNTVLKYLNSGYGNMTPYFTPECEYYFFYFLNNEKIIAYNWATKEVHIRYSIVWSFLINFFNLPDHEIHDIMFEWLDNRYNIKTPKIYTLNDDQFSWIKKLP